MQRFGVLIVAVAWIVAAAVVLGCAFLLWLGAYGLGEPGGSYGYSVFEVAGIVAIAAAAVVAARAVSAWSRAISGP